jgi:hypothetical protein
MRRPGGGGQGVGVGGGGGGGGFKRTIAKVNIERLAKEQDPVDNGSIGMEMRRATHVEGDEQH